MIRRLVLVAAVAVVAAEWWSRFGREWLLGPRAPETPIGPEILTVNVRVPPPQHVVWADGALADLVGESVAWEGEPAGLIAGAALDGRDAIVTGAFERAKLGWPINVAVSQAEEATRRVTLALATAAMDR